MAMMKFASPTFLLALWLSLAPAGGRAWAQGDVLFPGSTAQGDIMRGKGVQYRRAAIFYLNSAKARSIDADTEMRFNQYVYEKPSGNSTASVPSTRPSARPGTRRTWRISKADSARPRPNSTSSTATR